MNNRLKLLLPASLVVVAMVANGCSAGQQVTAADIIQHMRDAAKTIKTAQSTLDLSLTINKQGIQTLASGLMSQMGGDPSQSNKAADAISKLPDTVTGKLKVWKQAADGTNPAKARVEVAESSLPGVGGVTLVYDGQKGYAYVPSQKTLYTATPQKLIDKIPDEVKAALQSVDVQQELDKVLNAADIKLQGTEQVSGIDAYKLDITPKPDAAATLGIPQAYQMQAGVLIKDLHMTLWVDQNRWVPLKVEVDHPSLGQFTSTASDVQVNAPIDQSEFVLQVGSDVKRVDLDQIAQSVAPQSITLSKAHDIATNAGWTLLEPSYVPAGSTLVGVTQAGAGKPMFNSIQLSYSSPAADFTIIEAKPTGGPAIGGPTVDLAQIAGALKDNGTAKEVTVRGVTARAVSSSGYTALYWQEPNGVWIVIHGKLSLDETTKVAAGLR
jgi:outer membrane lipoprotein-sorting protein